ncbi:hypothetical protein Tco_0521111, partial [Tanacetum coccineum]
EVIKGYRQLHQSPPQSPLHQSPPHSPHQSTPQSPPHFSPPRSYEAPLSEGNTSGSAEDSMQLKELMVLVPTLVTRINSLEKELKDTKQTLGNAMLKLVKKVKSLEIVLKRKSKKVLISESEGEESEDQGRKIQDIDDDPLVSCVKESMKEKSIDFVTPTKASGEAHEEEISPTILEAAKTLSKVASQGVCKEKSTDKGKRYRRRARSMAKKIDTRLDAEEEINIGREEINTGIEEVSTGSTKVDSGTTSKRGQKERKGSNAKIEENTELTKDVLGKDLPEQDFAKRMAEMVNQRKKHFAEERAKAKRNKPMTQSQLRIYMSNYLKNQGTWKLSQLKKLKFEEIKEEFDKLVQQIDTFVPINLKATKAKLKRYGEEIQKKTSKKQRFDDKDVPAIGEKVAEVKEEEQVKRTGKRKKQKARKGINVDKSAQEDSETDKEESVEAMNPTPLTTKSDSVVNWKIFQQGQISVYQIIRANGADTVYMNFGAMIKDFTREDLIDKWKWRFLTEKWLFEEKLKKIYGEDGGFSALGNSKGHHGTWHGIINDVVNIIKLDGSFISSFKLKASNGSDTLFWKDKWGRALNELSSLTSLIGNLTLSDDGIDKWIWAKDASRCLKVKSLSTHIQEVLLVEHRLRFHHVTAFFVITLMKRLSIVFLHVPRFFLYGGSYGVGGTLTSLSPSLPSQLKINKVVHAPLESHANTLDEDIFPSIQRLSKLWISARCKPLHCNWRSWISRPWCVFNLV